MLPRKITVERLKQDDQKPIRKTYCQSIRMNVDRIKFERMMKKFSPRMVISIEKLMLYGPMVDPMPMNAMNFIQ